MAAPKGNKNAQKARIWSDAIRMALAKDKSRMLRLANALLDAAEKGDISALKEVGDRLEGKVTQPISGPEDGPIETKWTVTFVNASPARQPKA